MVLESCRFETERLLVNEWHSVSPSDWHQQKLSQVVAALLTESVTNSLPAPWQGSYTIERAREWIQARDEEGTTLLVIEKRIHQAVGLMILVELHAEETNGDAEIRLGYLISENAWGKGIASELVRGFITWCSGQPSILSIAAGVASDNPASNRVLEKNGFKLDRIGYKEVRDGLLYRLNV
jgi:RimJ/RimL family protein N-acetyltransferase